MKCSAGLLVFMLGACLGAPSRASADPSQIPPQTQGRLDTLGRLAGDAPFCEQLGYASIDRDGRAFAREIALIAQRVGIDPKDAEAAVNAAKAREASDTRATLEKVQANLTDAHQDKAVRAFSDQLAVACDRAADDPVASVLMKPPPGEVSDLSRRYADSLLAPYRRASWQSQYVLAGGDLAEAVGACEQRLSRPQARAYLAELRDPTRFPPEINDTIQAWLDARVSAGQKAAQSAAQCKVRLAKQRTALNKAPVD